MDEQARGDVRRLLKTFGIQADEAIMAHLAQVPEGQPLRLRVSLEDITDYRGYTPGDKLFVEIEGEIRNLPGSQSS